MYKRQVPYPTKAYKRKSSQCTWSAAGKRISFLPLHLDTGLLPATLSSSRTSSTSQPTPWIIEIIVILIFWSFWFLRHTFFKFWLFYGNNVLIYSKQCLLCNRCSKYQYSYLQLLLYFESEYVVELQWFVSCSHHLCQIITEQNYIYDYCLYTCRNYQNFYILCLKLM